MKLFLKYLRCIRKTIIIFAVFAAVFVATFMLYRLPLGAVLYPICLCVFISVIAVCIDYYYFLSKHKSLLNHKKFSLNCEFNDIKTDSVIEKDYLEIIDTLKNDISYIKDEDYKKYFDMLEYYTVWAHQIKTPIASMKLSLQNEDTKLSRKLSSDLLRTQSYVDMVLAFLRLDSPSTDYLFKEYSLDSIIHSAVKKFATEFILRKLSIDCEEINKTVVTDEKWFSFVLEQIISNALKYTKEGKIKIYIKNDNTLCISDTGIGIASEDLPRIFEKGYTGYNGRSDKTASGIGLYLCRRICDNLGLKIYAESEVYKGTDVYIEFCDKTPQFE